MESDIIDVQTVFIHVDVTNEVTQFRPFSVASSCTSTHVYWIQVHFSGLVFRRRFVLLPHCMY